MTTLETSIPPEKLKVGKTIEFTYFVDKVLTVISGTIQRIKKMADGSALISVFSEEFGLFDLTVATSI